MLNASINIFLPKEIKCLHNWVQVQIQLIERIASKEFGSLINSLCSFYGGELPSAVYCRHV